MSGIERLRALAGAWDEWGLGGALADIAEQIERERDAEVADSPYDAILPEDRDAIAWVREHGGLGAVKEEWKHRSNLRRMCEKEGAKVERQQRHIEFVQGKCRERQGRIVALRKELAELRKVLSDYRDALGGMCERLGITDGTSLPEMPDVICEALDRRLMPEGCEWPRYESGELVNLGDDVSRHGDDFEVNVITLYRDGSFSLNFWAYSKGERVRRPAVPAADGEPLEVGQTVWRIDTGAEYWVKSGQTITSDAVVIIRKTDCDCESEIVKASQLTHQRPVLDADGNRIEPAMDVWWVCEGDERGVHAEKLHVESIGEDGLVTCDPFNGGTWVELEPSELYVKKPVLDADGVPIKKGDTVWHIETSREYVVVEPSYGETVVVRLAKHDDAEGEQYAPDQLTHTKPEPPDSAERIADEIDRLREEVALHLGDYLYDEDGNDSIQSSMELVAKRCRALAERGES